MRVAPRDLKAVRAAGLLTRYAVLGEAVFSIVELPPGGSAGTSLEQECRLEHRGLVVKGEVTLVEAPRTRTLRAGTAFHVPPGPIHRFGAPSTAVIAGFAPRADPLADPAVAVRSQGGRILRRIPAATLPPATVRVEGLGTHTVIAGAIETESALMGDWLFTRTSFGALSGHLQPWCDLPHWGLVLDGDLVIRWEDGELELLGRGDAFHCPVGPPAHRIEVADAARIVDYTPVASVDDPGLRRAPRALRARAAERPPHGDRTEPVPA